METRSLGNTGIRVSEVGLGCGFLHVPAGFDPRTLLSEALALGVTLYDTGDFYCDYRSERWLGETFASMRDQVVIVTKFGTLVGADGAFHKDWTVAHMRRALDASLERLGTSWIDVYLAHSPPPEILDRDDLFEALERAKVEGKIRAYGLSLYGLDLLREAIRRRRADVIEIHFNLFNQEAIVAFPQAIATGVGLIARRPMDAGMLAGALGPDAPFRPGDPRPRWGQDSTRHRQAMLESLNFLTEGTGRTRAQAALEFVLSHEAVSAVIPSTTCPEHLRENAAAGGRRLNPGELQRLATLLDGGFTALRFGY
jgi:aryl-alcohol dehydrogenase-like predicted oxidoreductase